MKAEPFSEGKTDAVVGLAEAIEDGLVAPRDDPKIRGRYLADNYNWDINEARKIW